MVSDFTKHKININLKTYIYKACILITSASQGQYN